MELLFLILRLALCSSISSARRHVDSVQSSADAPLKVLSYNICWGCMEADVADATGMSGDLKEVCMQRTDIPGVQGDNGMGLPVTKCALNMRQSISQFDKDIGGYDLMGFQEASNWGDLDLQRALPNIEKVEYGSSSSRMRHTKGDHRDELKKYWMVSAFNKKRMGNYSVKVEGVLKSEAGRLYLILIFDATRVMFINVHNTHPGLGKKSEGTAPKRSFNNFPEEMNEKLEEAFNAMPARKNYRVIMVGDFNDGKTLLPGCLALPWNGAVMSLANAAKTCCTGSLGKKSSRLFAGDYIFDSAGLATNRLPPAYDIKVAQSDHRPIEAILAGASTSYSDQENVPKKKRYSRQGSSAMSPATKTSRGSASPKIPEWSSAESHRLPKKRKAQSPLPAPRTPDTINILRGQVEDMERMVDKLETAEKRRSEKLESASKGRSREALETGRGAKKKGRGKRKRKETRSREVQPEEETSKIVPSQQQSVARKKRKRYGRKKGTREEVASPLPLPAYLPPPQENAVESPSTAAGRRMMTDGNDFSLRKELASDDFWISAVHQQPDNSWIKKASMLQTDGAVSSWAEHYGKPKRDIKGRVCLPIAPPDASDEPKAPPQWIQRAAPRDPKGAEPSRAAPTTVVGEGT